MKRTKKLFALLLAIVMVLVLIPTAIFAEENDENTETLNYGYRRSPSHGTRAITDAYLRGDMETYNRLTGKGASNAVHASFGI